MIPTQLLGFSINAGYGSAISSVGAVDELGGDKDNVGSAAGMRLFIVFGAVIFIPHLLLNGGNLSFAVIACQDHIHSEEGLPQGLLVLAHLVVFVALEFFQEMPLDKCCYLGT